MVNPKISIITAVFNGEEFLEETIKSVINQTYENIEYIIIDGGSTDGTVDIIKKYEKNISYWVSETDNGIGDAFNKGVEKSTGDYINFQGDGDGFVANDVLEKTFNIINNEMFISTRIKRVDINGKEIFSSKYIESFNYKSLLWKMSMPHQGLFTHKEYFKKYGLFDVNNIFSMDYDHLLRSYHSFPKVLTKNIITAKWRDDGIGNGRILEIYREYDQIKRKNKVTNNILLSCINYWILLKYYVKKVITFA